MKRKSVIEIDVKLCCGQEWRNKERFSKNCIALSTESVNMFLRSQCLLDYHLETLNVTGRRMKLIADKSKDIHSALYCTKSGSRKLEVEILKRSYSEL